MEREAGGVAMLEPQICYGLVFATCSFQKVWIAIDAQHEALRSHGLGNPQGDGAGSKANVENGKARPQQGGEMAMIRLKSSTIQDSRIGLVLLLHLSQYSKNGLRRVA